MCAICSKKVWPPVFQQWKLPFRWLRDKKKMACGGVEEAAATSQGQQQSVLLTKSLKRPSSSSSSLPFPIDIVDSFTEVRRSFVSPSNLQPIFSSPLALRLPPSLHWQGLYGLGNKRDLLFLLFLLVNLLPVIIFSPASASSCLFLTTPSTPPFFPFYSPSPIVIPPVLVPLFPLIQSLQGSLSSYLQTISSCHTLSFLQRSSRFLFCASKRQIATYHFRVTVIFTARRGGVQRWNERSEVTESFFTLAFEIMGRRQRKRCGLSDGRSSPLVIALSSICRLTCRGLQLTNRAFWEDLPQKTTLWLAFSYFSAYNYVCHQQLVGWLKLLCYI